MVTITDSLDRAAGAHFTRPIPKSAPAQMRFLIRQLKSAKAVAQALGVSQRTVERYAKDQLRHPRRDLAARLEREVRRRWQPRVRQRAQQRAATSGGIFISTRARFGFTAAPGTTDDPRIRHINQSLPPEYAARLFGARDTGASDQQLQVILAEGLGTMYFRDGGRRAHGLLVELTDIEDLDVEF